MDEAGRDAWAGEHEAPVPYRLDLPSLIASALTASGLGCDELSIAKTRARILQIGSSEWDCLSQKPYAITKDRACWLLGSGYVLTEFLIAPVVQDKPPQSLCSLGALMNLAVCCCDRLLDDGAEIDTLLPQAELLGGTPSTTPVTLLVQQYWHNLDVVRIDPPLRTLMLKAFKLMVSAEVETVVQKQKASYNTWLRKSSLPIVLMGLPAWALDYRDSVRCLSLQNYLQWLYQVGRLFGILDDAADFHSDLFLGHLNIFVIQNTNMSSRASLRAASFARRLMNYWDREMVGRPTPALLRRTFLDLIWEWLLPA